MTRIRLVGVVLLALVSVFAVPAAHAADRAGLRLAHLRGDLVGVRPAPGAPDRERAPAGTFQLSGAVSLTGGDGLSRGFRGEVIGFDDGAGGLVGQCVWTDERGDRVFSQLTGEDGGIRPPHRRHDDRRHRPLRRPHRRVHLRMAVRRRGRGRHDPGPRDRAARPRPRRSGRRERVRGVDRRGSPAASVALALVIWFVAAARGPDGPGVAPVRALRRRHLLRHRRRVPDPHRLGAGRRGHRPDGDADSRPGLRRIREFDDPAHRHGLPRGAGRREVRPGPAPRPSRREPVRPVDARPVLQHLPGGRPDRARVPEQHGAGRRASTRWWSASPKPAGRRPGTPAGGSGWAAT